MYVLFSSWPGWVIGASPTPAFPCDISRNLKHRRYYECHLHYYGLLSELIPSISNLSSGPLGSASIPTRSSWDMQLFQSLVPWEGIYPSTLLLVWPCHSSGLDDGWPTCSSIWAFFPQSHEWFVGMRADQLAKPVSFWDMRFSFSVCYGKFNSFSFHCWFQATTKTPFFKFRGALFSTKISSVISLSKLKTE